ncbi:MAG TPA: trypsin-like peptidase domain-containing protein [Phycisphaerae bacterium]|nr:trypsin-like peptidase domain-containing protein [Phycisphaerae bacterium]
MKSLRGTRRVLLASAAMLGAVALTFHADLIGRVSYALEKGKLEAEFDHLENINLTDILPLEQLSHAYSVIADAVKPSVVFVQALTENSAEFKELEKKLGRYNIQPEPSIGTGSGVIVDEEGYIVTNNHVVEDADDLRVILSDGRRYYAKVVGTDPKTDVAVIKIKADNLIAARLGDSDRTKVGHIVLAIGSPFRLGHSVSHGIISALGRSNVDVDIEYQNWIQTDAPINPGNSGGPLINARGEVIGINCAIATESGGHQGVGFAIPSNVVKNIARQLKTHKRVVRGYLGVGIKTVDQAVAGAYGLQQVAGVLIEQVGSGSPAAHAGLMAEDIIFSISGQKLSSIEQLQQIVAGIQPDSSVDMSVWRKGEVKTVPVKIGRQPDQFSTNGALGEYIPNAHRDGHEEPTEGQEGAYFERNGGGGSDESILDSVGEPDADRESDSDPHRDTEPSATFDEAGFQAATLSPDLVERYGLDAEIASGAVVTQVSPTREAFFARMRAGQVITEADGQPVHGVGDLRKILTDEAVAKGVRLRLRWRSSEFRAILRVE